MLIVMRYLLPFVAVLFTATLIWSRDSDRREFCKTRNAPTHPSVFVNDCMSARCWNVSKKMFRATSTWTSLGTVKLCLVFITLLQMCWPNTLVPGSIFYKLSISSKAPFHWPLHTKPRSSSISNETE